VTGAVNYGERRLQIRLVIQAWDNKILSRSAPWNVVY